MQDLSRLTGGSNWGYFGGAFDPPHTGHLRLAEQLSDKAGLDGVLFSPSAHPGHRKQALAEFADRLKMVELTCRDYDQFLLCDIEKDIKPPTYTVRVIESLKRRLPTVNFSLLLGSDNLRILPQWREIDRLLKLAQALIGARPGAPIDEGLLRRWGNRIRVIEIEPTDISSSVLRQKIKQGDSLNSFLTPQTLEYIRERNLYQ